MKHITYRKGIALAVILLFFSVSVVPSSANLSHQFDANLKTGIGVILHIENIGNETINSIEWWLCVKGGYFGLINKSKTGYITQIKPCRKIPRRIIVFGYGYVNISFGVVMPPQEPGQPITMLLGSGRMFIIGPFTYRQSPIICIK